jgi:hypothetical protein
MGAAVRRQELPGWWEARSRTMSTRSHVSHTEWRHCASDSEAHDTRVHWCRDIAKQMLKKGFRAAVDVHLR